MMELMLALFLTSGPIKAFFSYYRIPFPIDFTVLCAGTIVLLLGVQFVFRFSPPKLTTRFTYSFTLLILFYAWMLVSAFYSVSPRYSQEKCILFINTMLAFCVPIFARDFSPARMIKWFMFLGYPMALMFSISLYRNYVAKYSKSFLGFHANYLPLSEQVGLGVICLASVPQIVRIDWLRPLLIVAGYILILLTGARGPLVFLVFCHLLVLLQKSNRIDLLLRPRFVIQAAIGGILALGIGIVLWSSYPEQVGGLIGRTTERFVLLLSDSRDDGSGQGAGVRLHLFEKSLGFTTESASSFVFGKGIGSFGLLYLGKDERYYPHHIFLEVLVEMGAIGLIIFCAFLFMVLSHRAVNGVVYRVPILFLILNCLKSHTVVDLRVVFACLGIYLLPKRDPSLDVTPT